jgi:putative transposase
MRDANVRRPPIAQRRITRIEKGSITFWAKDKKRRRLVDVQYTVKEFIDSWIQHIPQRYQHCMRYFGLFAPRAVSQTMAAIFAAVGQMRRPWPKRRRWANSIMRDFGWNPLLDHTGARRCIGYADLNQSPPADPAQRAGS